jgi:hypothetical protein
MISSISDCKPEGKKVTPFSRSELEAFAMLFSVIKWVGILIYCRLPSIDSPAISITASSTPANACSRGGAMRSNMWGCTSSCIKIPKIFVEVSIH